MDPPSDETKNGQDYDQRQQQHMQKDLRSAIPDLEVVVGEGYNQRTYQYHSIMLAFASNYIDTLLVTPMSEQETRRLSFPEISPDEWELMMQHADPRSKEVLLTFSDAMILAKWYDKYAFEAEKLRCDKTIAKSAFSYEIPYGSSLSVEECVDALVVADCANLIMAIEAGTEFFSQFFLDKFYVQTLTEENIGKLTPFIAKSDDIWEAVESLFGPGRIERESICSNPLFPVLLKSKLDLRSSLALVKDLKPSVQIHGSPNPKADGVYELRVTRGVNMTRFSRYPQQFYERGENAWHIRFVETESAWFVGEESRNRDWRPYYWCQSYVDKGLPPRGDWKIVESSTMLVLSPTI